MSLLLTIICILSLNETKINAKEVSVALGIFDSDEQKLIVVHRLKNNETLKMYKGQTFDIEDTITDYNVVGYDKIRASQIIYSSYGNQNTRLHLSPSFFAETGIYTIQLFDKNGKTVITFKLKLVEATENPLDGTPIDGVEKAYIKMDKNGIIKEYYEVTLKNISDSTMKIAILDIENTSKEPSFKTIKSGKTKVLKYEIDTYDNIDELKQNYKLTKKQIKKLKSGKKVYFKDFKYYLYAAGYYRGIYFGRRFSADGKSGESDSSAR